MKTLRNFILSNRRFFFLLIGFFSRIIRKLFYFNNINRKHKLIAVCGRGFSANKFFLKDFFLHTKVYLSNFSPKDLPRFKDYLKLQNKEISIVSNIEEWTPNIIYSLFLDIRETIIARPNNIIKSKNGRSKREVYRLDALGLKVRGIKHSKSLSEYPMSLGNTGFLTLYEACEYAKKNNITSIYVYGFDLYSTDKCIKNLFREECTSDESYIAHRKANKKLSKQMDYLISLYPQIHFKNYTLNRFNFKSENIENIYLNN